MKLYLLVESSIYSESQKSLFGSELAKQINRNTTANAEFSESQDNADTQSLADIAKIAVEVLNGRAFSSVIDLIGSFTKLRPEVDIEVETPEDGRFSINAKNLQSDDVQDRISMIDLKLGTKGKAG